MEASRSQTASVVTGAGSAERPRLEGSTPARLRALIEIEVEPAAPDGVRQPNNVVPATSARQGISLEPNTITPRVYPSVFPGHSFGQ